MRKGEGGDVRTTAYLATFVGAALIACGPSNGLSQDDGVSPGVRPTPRSYPYVRHVTVNGKDCAYTVNWQGGPITGQEVGSALTCP